MASISFKQKILKGPKTKERGGQIKKKKVKKEKKTKPTKGKKKKKKNC